MSEENSLIAIEEVLAALVKQNGAAVLIEREHIESPNEGKVLTFSYDPQRDGLSVDLADAEDIVYEDE
jgi:hypothetical protein